MAPRAVSAAARSPSPDKRLLSRDDIPPLAYDTEAELLAVLSRLESDLKKRIDIAFNEGNATGADREEVEKIVLEQFFKGMAPLVWSNCTIAGLPYSKYQSLKSKGKLTKTKAFDDVLHQRVMNYQNQLFDAREQNVRERVDVPKSYAAGVQEVVAKDLERLAQLEDAKVIFPEERPTPILSTSAPAPPTKGRKSIGGAKASAEEGPTAQQSQDDYAKASEEIDRLLKEIPRLSSATEQATRVALDTAALQ